jgi:hypothetical protein
LRASARLIWELEQKRRKSLLSVKDEQLVGCHFLQYNILLFNRITFCIIDMCVQ